LVVKRASISASGMVVTWGIWFRKFLALHRGKREGVSTKRDASLSRRRISSASD
jgi:hypothetical protein